MYLIHVELTVCTKGKLENSFSLDLASVHIHLRELKQVWCTVAAADVSRASFASTMFKYMSLICNCYVYFNYMYF